MDFGTERFEAKILNTGNTVHNMAEFIEIAGEYVYVVRMRGKHGIIIENNRLHYEFEIQESTFK